MPAHANNRTWVGNWGEATNTAEQEIRAYKKQVNADANIRLRMIQSARSLTPQEADHRLTSLIRAPLAGLR